MPTSTYDLISSNVLSSSSSSITLSSIPATYRDLVLVMDLLAFDNSQYSAQVRANNDSGSNYFDVFMRGNGGSGISSNATVGAFRVINAATTTEKAFTIFHFIDYSATDKHKTALQRTGAPSASDTGVYLMHHRWANTAAISSLSISTAFGQFAAGSSFYLYGIVS